MTTLISFLGRGADNRNRGYRTARYRFPDGNVHETAFFGLALARTLNPQRIVLLGTAGSMWSVLTEHLSKSEASQDTYLEDERLALLEAEENQSVDEFRLGVLQPLAEHALKTQVELRLIPDARDDHEQIEILEAIAASVERGAVHIDVTHGFRHLGMIGFLSAYLIESLRRQVHVEGVWYGALDMTALDSPQAGHTPVLRLDALGAVQQWINALARFDASGDYGVFAPMLQADHFPTDKAACLVAAHFHETTLNVVDARRKLQTVLTALEAETLSGASALFQSRLIERLRWVRDPDLSSNQRLLALRALDRGDILRAALLGIEALITHECGERGLEPYSRSDRETVGRALQTELRNAKADSRWIDSYRDLNQLRNAMAHGTPPPSHRLSRLIGNADQLKQELRRHIDRLNA